MPLAEQLASQQQTQTLVIGINGCQGSGKSTLAALLSALLSTYHNKSVATLSLDDFYLTIRERQQLARKHHPLLLTRGVPGTHDTSLLADTLSNLKKPGLCAVPRFNKATDDRKPEPEWDHINSPMDIILLEGWCVGVRPQTKESLLRPINALERMEDEHGVWRSFVNSSIKSYQPIFETLDMLIMLKAPNFSCVSQWRGLQESKLALTSTGSGVMNTHALQRFIQHYQRITEHMLTGLPDYADHLFLLNNDQEIIDYVKA